MRRCSLNSRATDPSLEVKQNIAPESSQVSAKQPLKSSLTPHPWLGYFYIAAAALCWGLSANSGKAMFGGHSIFGLGPVQRLDVTILSQSRVTISFLVLATVLLVTRGRRTVAMSAGDVLRCMVLGVLGVVGSNYFYYYAISVTSVSIAIIVQYTAPVWVLLYMVARRYQRLTLARVSAVGAALAGVALVIGIGDIQSGHLAWRGVGASLLAAFSFCFYNIYGRRLVAVHDRWQVIAYALLGASVFWIVINPPWKIVAARYSSAQWIFLVLFAFMSMLIPFSFYYAGLRYLDPTRAIVTSCLEPVFTILIAAAFLAERLGPLHVVGIVLVLTATIVVQMPKN